MKKKTLPKILLNSIISPIERFAQIEASSGIVLVFITLIALGMANSPLQHVYHSIVELPLGLRIGHLSFEMSLHHWVNDGLMVIFFFLVGLEIKRELAIGELSSIKKAALPMVAALGGMIVPALIYFVLNPSGVAASGWGIPMATDIAFAVGIMTLLSRKVPVALKIFLLALAIVDDLGAVLVIALFYTDEVVTNHLLLSGLWIGITLFLNRAGVRKVWIYWVVGGFVWYHIFGSGVHATVAGVILGLITPVEPLFKLRELGDRFGEFFESLTGHSKTFDQQVINEADFNEEQARRLSRFLVECKSPLDRLIHALHPWVSFGIMPVFAFANAGVTIGNDFQFSQFLSNPIALGIIIGLFIGKPIGIMSFSWLAVRLGIARLPDGVSWRQVFAISAIAGIGFTMALFIGGLALPSAEFESTYKIGVLIASIFAATFGLILLITSKDVES